MLNSTTIFKPLFIKIAVSLLYLVSLVTYFIAPQFFVQFFPFLILLNAIALVFSGPYKNKDFLRFCLFVCVAGFAISLSGLRTGKLFGMYFYGDSLGFKLKEVPVLTGVYWLVLTLSAQSLSSKITSHFFGASALGAFFILTIDILTEHAASALDLWHWHQNQIPIQNYVMWFVLSLLFLGIGGILKVEKENHLGVLSFSLLLVFWCVINLAR